MENHGTRCHGVYQKIFAICSSQRIYENQALCSHCGHDLKFILFEKPELWVQARITAKTDFPVLVGFIQLTTALDIMVAS
jgi:hypothetical protein